MQSNFPKKSLFLAAAFFCLSLAAFVFFIKTVTNNNAELKAKEIAWRTEAERREEIKQLDNSVKSIEDDRIELEKHFAKKSDVVPFLDTMENLARNAGTSEAEITSVDAAEDNSGLFVGMKASGSFSSVYKFIKLLENSPYEVNLLTVEMHKDTDSSIWNVTVKTKLVSFVS